MLKISYNNKLLVISYHLNKLIKMMNIAMFYLKVYQYNYVMK